MTALSLQLPNTLAKASAQIAKRLGISRVALIRRALIHELEAIQTQKEQSAMMAAFNAMRKNKSYLKETREIDVSFGDSFKDMLKDNREKSEWWTKIV